MDILSLPVGALARAIARGDVTGAFVLQTSQRTLFRGCSGAGSAPGSPFLSHSAGFPAATSAEASTAWPSA